MGAKAGLAQEALSLMPLVLHQLPLLQLRVRSRLLVKLVSRLCMLGFCRTGGSCSSIKLKIIRKSSFPMANLLTRQNTIRRRIWSSGSLTRHVCISWLVRLTLQLIGNIDKCILFWRGFLSWWAIRFNRWQCPSYFHWSHSRRRFQGYTVFKPFRVGRIQKWTAMEWAGQPNFHGTLVRLCSDHAG